MSVESLKELPPPMGPRAKENFIESKTTNIYRLHRMLPYAPETFEVINANALAKFVKSMMQDLESVGLNNEQIQTRLKNPEW